MSPAMTHWYRFASGAVTALALLAAAQAVEGQDTNLRGFADVTYHVSDADGDNNSFALGQYDLFLTSRLGEGWTFLGETVFEFVDDDFLADVERVVIEYTHSPQLKIAAGRMHTPIGFWFTEYHHGSLLEPVIDRPLAFRFEDEGGLLTSHQVGVRVSGRDIGALNLGYDVLVGNGVSSSPVSDDNPGKSITARLSSQVDHATKFGVSFNRDLVAAGTPISGGGHGGEHGGGAVLESDMEQMVYSTFFAHFGARFEFQTEALRIRNEDDLGATSSDSFYAYGGYRFGSLVPYVLYDRVDFSEHDPYYQSTSHSHASIGTRWDALGTTVVKFEGRREYGHEGGTFNAFTVQVAVGF